jgi:hypothetical protein
MRCANRESETSLPGCTRRQNQNEILALNVAAAGKMRVQKQGISPHRTGKCGALNRESDLGDL